MDAVRRTPGLWAGVSCLALAFLLLFALDTFVDSPTSRQQAQEYFSVTEIDRGLQYFKQRELLMWVGTGFQLALLTGLVCTNWGRRLADCFDRWTGRRWLLTLLLMGASFFLLMELLYLPLGLIRLDLARANHMSNRSTWLWLVDWAKGLGVNAVQGGIVVLGLYGLMYLFPRRWWLLASFGGAMLGALYAFLLPEFIQPLFNTFTPLNDPYLRARVTALAKLADVPVDDVQVMNASSRSRHTNAYFVGFGSTRRIVLYDTLLEMHSGLDATSTARLVGLLGPGGGCEPWLATSEIFAARTAGVDEMDTIIAHEIGHWKNHHIVKGILLSSCGGLLALFLLSRILQWAVGRRPFALTSPTDPAGLPLILLLFMLASWLVMPVENAISRTFERQADMASLELSKKPVAFIEAEKRMARDNISNVAPTPFNAWLFGTHPPALERMDMAKKWEERGRVKGEE